MSLLRAVDRFWGDYEFDMQRELHALLDKRIELEIPAIKLAFLARTRREISQACTLYRRLQKLDKTIAKHQKLLQLYQRFCPVEKLVWQDRFMLCWPLRARTVPFMRHLDLSNNNLRIVPKEICRLPGLQVLILRNNQISCFAQNFDNLKFLIHLDLFGNSIFQVPWDAIQGFTDLKTLDLRHNPIANLPPPELPCSYVYLRDPPPTPRFAYLDTDPIGDIPDDEEPAGRPVHERAGSPTGDSESSA